MSDGQLSERAQGVIEELHEAYGVPVEKLRGEYTRRLGEWEEQDVSSPEDRALQGLSMWAKGSDMSGREETTAVLLGTTDPIDTTRKKCREARDAVDRLGRGEAAKDGYVRPVSGEIPDNVSTITVDGDEMAVLDANENSPTHGEVVPWQEYIRVVAGVAWRTDAEAGDRDPKLFSAVVEGRGADRPPEPPVRHRVRCEARWRNEDERTAKLGLDGAEPFEVVSDDEVAGRFLADSERPKALEVPGVDADLFGPNELVLVRGAVDYMQLDPDNGNNRRLSIRQPIGADDTEITVWLEDAQRIDFNEMATVWAIGTVSPPSSPEYPPSVEANGVVPHPDYKLEMEEVQSFSEPDGEAGADSESDPGPDPDPDPAPEAPPDPAQDGEPSSPPADTVVDPDPGPDTEDPATTDGGREPDGPFETTEADREWEW